MAVVIGFVFVPQPALVHALELTDDVVSSSDIQSALSTIDSTLVLAPVSSDESSEFAAKVSDGQSTLEIPRDAGDDISVELDGAEIGIGLPQINSSNGSTRLTDGTIVYPSNQSSANAVIPLENGVQLLTTISNQNSDDRFTYDLSLPPGYRVQLVEYGAEIVNEAGQVLIKIPAPWAVDAAGAHIATHYVTDGMSLTQIVDHKRTADVVYPVVADPTYFWGGQVWLNPKQVNNAQIAALLLTFGFRVLGPFTTAALMACNQAGRGIWVYWTWAGHVWCTGP